MKKIEKCFKYLCCFNSFTAERLEIFIISASIIGVILTIIGLVVIHWKYTSKVMKVFQVLSLIFFLLLIFISSFFLYLRKKFKEIKYLTLCILLCFFELFLCVFSIFINLFTVIGTLPDLKEYNDKEDTNTYNPTGNANNSENNKTYLVSNGELSYAIIYLIIIIFIWIMLLFLCLSDLIRIKLRISGSYNNYLKMQIPHENSKADVNVYIQNDKSGYPINKKEEEKSYDKENEKKENGMVKRSSTKINEENKYDNNITNKSLNRFDSEKKNILKYSYKEKNCNSVDDIHKSKNGIEKYEKEKYLEKYLEGYGANPYYSNFGNKSILNISTMNNSISP